jgi:hypothetical protein
MTQPTYDQKVLHHPDYQRTYQQLRDQGAPVDVAAQQAYERTRQGMARAKRTNRVILGALAAVLALVVVSTVGAALSSQPTPTDTATSTSATPRAVAPPVTEDPPTAGPAYTPVPTDFVLKVIVLSKACFGSAGCNVTYRIDVAYSGVPVGDDAEYVVTYAVSGVEGGPQVNNFTLRGDQVEYQAEEFASTPSARTVLAAKVTQVLS